MWEHSTVAHDHAQNVVEVLDHSNNPSGEFNMVISVENRNSFLQSLNVSY